MPRVDHIAIWTADLERLRRFYEAHLGARAGSKYVNAAKRFESYFLCFEGGARIEIMHAPSVVPASPVAAVPAGYAHVAISVGSRDEVVALSERLRAAGCPLLDGPRVTGDGYFECVVLDPDGNRIEITV